LMFRAIEKTAIYGLSSYNSRIKTLEINLEELSNINYKYTLLIAEPTEMLISELYKFLSDRGVNIVQTRNLKDTLLILQKQRVDVLVINISLLGQDFAFISIIKGIEEGLQIIVCAETNTPEFESSIRQQGIFFYHLKSFGIQDLKIAISNAIEKASKYSGGSSDVFSDQNQ